MSACSPVTFPPFCRFEDFGHSKAARTQLKDFLIGAVHVRSPACPPPLPALHPPAPTQPDDVEKLAKTAVGGGSKGGSDNPSLILFAAGILLVLAALYFKFGPGAAAE